MAEKQFAHDAKAKRRSRVFDRLIGEDFTIVAAPIFTVVGGLLAVASVTVFLAAPTAWSDLSSPQPQRVEAGDHVAPPPLGNARVSPSLPWDRSIAIRLRWPPQLHPERRS